MSARQHAIAHQLRFQAQRMAQWRLNHIQQVINIHARRHAAMAKLMKEKTNGANGNG